MIVQDDWSSLGVKLSTCLSPEFTFYPKLDLSNDPPLFTFTDVQPHLLKAKVSKSDPDNPSWLQAMNCTDADIWWTAMTTMLETLEVILQPWKLVEDEPWMKNLPCTWAFQIKHFPDDLIKKFKACCICGDCQTEGVDFLEIWSHVVQYSMVRTMMILSTK